VKEEDDKFDDDVEQKFIYSRLLEVDELEDGEDQILDHI
jgi:hypothetical protein